MRSGIAMALGLEPDMTRVKEISVMSKDVQGRPWTANHLWGSLWGHFAIERSRIVCKYN